MPSGGGLGGIAAAEAIRREDPAAAIVLLSTDIDGRIAQRLIATGSWGIGYLSKDRVTDLEGFVAAIRTVAAGGCALDDELNGPH